MHDIRKQGENRTNESGMMTIEVVVSMIVFLVFFAFLVNLINIYSFHNRMQYALEASAHDIAGISYPLYVMSGLRDFDKEVKGDAKDDINANDATVNQLFDTYDKAHKISYDLSGLGDFADSAKESYEMVQERVDNIDSTLIGIVWRLLVNGQNYIKDEAGQEAAGLLIPQYLEISNTNMSTVESYEVLLEQYKVENLSFKGTEIFPDATSLIKLEVQYDINVSFFNIRSFSDGKGFLSGIIGDGNKIHVVQCAVASGWLDGDGEYLKKYR